MRSETAARPIAAAGQEAPGVLDELMTSRQLADVLQLRASTVEDYARRGLLPSIKLGRHRRFLRSQVERAIADLVGRWPA